MTEPTFDAFTGKPLKSDPTAEAQFNAHTGPPVAEPVEKSEPADDGDADDKPAGVIGSDVPPFGSPVPFDGPMVEAPIGANDGSISSEVETLIRETHTMVTEVHAFVAQLLEQVPTIVSAVESSPLGGMLGGLFGKNK